MPYNKQDFIKCWGVAKRPVSAEAPRRGRIRQNSITTMKGYIYILFSDKDYKTYLGSTNDIHRRIEDHFLGKVSATKYRRPLRLIYNEEHGNLVEARKRERYLKSHAGRNKLKEILKNIIK